MILEIIITRYKETIDVINNAIESIKRQININNDNIAITLVNDNPQDPINIEGINIINNNVNVGAGVSRQIAINNSVCDYLTFLDCDDELYGTDSLSRVIDFINSNKPNVLFTNFYEEVYNFGNIKPVKRNYKDLYCLHGLFINRKYLIDNNYKFHDTLRLYEDTYFCNVLFCTSRCEYLDVDTYIWKYNKNSLTQEFGKEFLIKNFDSQLTYVKDSYNELNKRMPNRFNDFIIIGIYELYSVLASDLFLDKKYSKLQKTYEKNLYKLYKENIGLFNSLNQQYKNNLLKIAIDGTLKRNPNIKILISFEDFLKKQKNRY